MRRAHDRIVERMLRAGQRGFARMQRRDRVGVVADRLRGRALLLLRLRERHGRVALAHLRLIELLCADVALRGERREPVHVARREIVVLRRALDLLGGDGRIRALADQRTAARVERRAREFEIGLRLRDGQPVRHGIDHVQQVAFRDALVFMHGELHDATADRRRDVHDVGVDRRVVGGRVGRRAVVRVRERRDAERDDRERDHAAFDGGASDAGGLHANGPVPVSQTITAITSPIAVQTASW